MHKKIKEILSLVKKSRSFQINLNNKMLKKNFYVPIHLALGHEFVSSLVKVFFKKNDILILSHRNIHFTSIFSKKPEAYYSNFFKKKNVYKYSGSMNYFDPKCKEISYCSSILGNNFSIACGFGFKAKKGKNIVICNAGDGAIEEGTFYESIMLAKSLKLPIVYLIEDNDWSMSTKKSERRCKLNIKYLGKSLNVRHHFFPLKDIKKNISKYEEAIKYCREKNEPIILEFEVNTLGKVLDKISGKVNKYHHGKISIKDGLFDNNDIFKILNK